MGNIFIRRPILAMVLAIIMVIVGGVALMGLPISQYPDITPPSITVSTVYTGATALDVEKAVAAPIEQEVNGVDKMLYVKSSNDNAGNLRSEVVFDVGTDLNMASVLTQNRVSLANGKLPEAVKQYGLSVKKTTALPTLMLTLGSPNGTWDETFLTNYAGINIIDRLSRTKGVGDVRVFGGSDYSMRVWVRPDRLSTMGMTVSDVLAAISAQNTVAPAGQLGGAPTPAGTEFTYTVTTQGRLTTADEFGNIIVRSNPDGSQVRLKDVARVEMGSLTYQSKGRLDGKTTCNIGVYQAAGSNALEMKTEVLKAMDEMSRSFPKDLNYVCSLDSTKAVSAGINEIVQTLFEAVILVILVVFVFLQNWRATLIPLVTVPVSLIATFAVFPLLGFSINVLSLLGLVLAIGIVVDDSIVVVEAVTHHMEQGLGPKEATALAMKEVTGPVIAIALILIAVFIPVAFMGGITGRLYQQFAVTISISVAFSAISALTLSPALASKFLRLRKPGEKHFLDPFYNKFNAIFGRTTERYMSFTAILIRRGTRSLILVGGILLLAFGLLKSLPGGFLPNEDNGYYCVSVQLPPAASLERTDAAVKKAEKIMAQNPGVEHVTSIIGYNLLTNCQAPNSAFLFATAKPWEERKSIKERLDIAILLTSLEFYKQIPEAQAFAFAPPPITGLGSGAGFTFMLQDRSGHEPKALADITEKFLAEAQKRKEIGRINCFFNASVPQYYADIDREKAQKLGVPLEEINRTLGGLLGSSYINDFNRFGRVYRVFLQAEPEFRTSPKALGQFFVRSNSGQMVPLDTLVTLKESQGPDFTARFNLYRAAEISGVPAEGYTNDDAHRALEETAAKVLTDGWGYDWANLSYQEKKASGTGSIVFVFALVFVFLILAAQYESWSLPLSVLLGTPFAMLGAALGLWLCRHILPSVWGASYIYNVFAQIGMITLIGLAAKNAILIVEYAKMKQEEGHGLVESALEAARLRFRPILMTAFAFIMGVLPLVRASGAMAESRKVMGMAVFAGMLVATALGVCFIPALFVLVSRIGHKKDAEPVPGSTGDLEGKH